jgi:DNA-binding transcriptional ArsR family regulator
LALEGWEAASALGHPVRFAVVMVLAKADEPTSPLELSRRLELPLGRVSHHVRKLYGMGAVRLVDTQPRRGAVEHFYVLSEDERLRAAIRALRPGAGPQSG